MLYAHTYVSVLVGEIIGGECANPPHGTKSYNSFLNVQTKFDQTTLFN